MPRQSKKLTALAVDRIKKVGWHSVGEGLWLQVKASGSRSWLFRYMLQGKPHGMGLGQYPVVSLAKAREEAAKCKALLVEGEDPIAARDSGREQERLEAARKQTFKQCAEAFIESHKSGWRNPKSESQWKASLEVYVYPLLGDLPVQDIDTTLVLKVLEQKKSNFKGVRFWNARPETASRIRNRVENVLDWAAARDFRRGENPARWRGHLENLLPKRAKLVQVTHHAALQYEQIGDFLRKLRKLDGIGVDAFELLILTASRTSEILGANWGEFDLEKRLWVIPAGRIKAGREHRVPLSGRAVEILRGLKTTAADNGQQRGVDGFVFAGRLGAKPLSKMGLLSLLKRMGCRGDVTVHGFRSTFRDWCAEQTAFPREVAEAALAHSSGDKVEQAYMRSDLFEKRRRLMDAWAEYCLKPTPKKGDNVRKLLNKVNTH